MYKSKIGNNLTQGNVFKTLILFTLPILLGNMFQQLYGVADSIVVGRVLGEHALAAVGASLGISNIILAIAMGITLGIGIIISKMVGEDDIEKLQNAVDTGLLIVVVLGSIITIFGFLGCDLLLSLFNVPEEIWDEAGSYLRVIFIGTLPLFIYNAITNFLRGIGDSKTPLILLIIASLLNIFLDIVFVAGLNLGVIGAAVATIIAQIFVFLVCILYVNKHNEFFKIRIKGFRFDWNILKSGLAIGVPATMQQLFMSLGSSVLQILINGFGTTYISAYTAASKIDGFATMAAINIGKAMPNFIAQNEGAKKYDRVRKGINISIILMAIISILISTVIFLFADKLILLFCDSESVMKAGIEYLYIVSGFYIIFAFMQILNGILLGKGQSLISMISTIVTFCLLQVPVAYFLSKSIGVIGIWIAAPIGWIGGLIMRFIYYRYYTKKQSAAHSAILDTEDIEDDFIENDFNENEINISNLNDDKAYNDQTEVNSIIDEI